MKTPFVAGLLLVSLAVTGCQTPVDEASGDIPPSSEDDSTLEGTPESDSPPAESAPDSETLELTIVLLPCSEGTREAIEATVVGQVDAFSVGDFEQAYQFASPGFQNGMPLDVFGTLIRLNYPQLLEATNARSGDCDADEDNGVSTIVMRFDTPSDPGYTLRYILEYVGDQWRISGASEQEVADTVASGHSATLSA